MCTQLAVLVALGPMAGCPCRANACADIIVLSLEPTTSFEAATYTVQIGADDALQVIVCTRERADVINYSCVSDTAAGAPAPPWFVHLDGSLLTLGALETPEPDLIEFAVTVTSSEGESWAEAFTLEFGLTDAGRQFCPPACVEGEMHRATW